MHIERQFVPSNVIKFVEKYIDVIIHDFPTKSCAKWGDLFHKIHFQFVEYGFLFIVISWITRWLIAVFYFCIKICWDLTSWKQLLLLKISRVVDFSKQAIYLEVKNNNLNNLFRNQGCLNVFPSIPNLGFHSSSRMTLNDDKQVPLSKWKSS